jgi:hypothetical protein
MNLDKVSVTRAVDVSIVPLLSGVLQVSGIDGDAAGSLLRCVVD